MGPIVFGLFFCTVLLFVLMREKHIVFEDLALGEGRTAVYDTLDGYPIHCKGVADASECIEGFENREHDGTVLWFGNSQLHAINQYEPGQKNAPPILSRMLRQQGLDLVAFSQPNANLQEHYILFEYLRTRLPIRQLILSVVFDDLRETGLRSDLIAAVSDPPTAVALGKTGIGQRILEDHPKLSDTNGGLGAVKETNQEHSEKFLNQLLDDHLPFWGVREQARGRFFVGLYRLRNTLLMIDPQSKRPMILGRYKANFAALDALLRSAREEQIPVLVYVVPLRKSAKTPYIEHEYAAFKLRLKELAGKYDVQFANLESLVDDEYWGTMESTNLGGKNVIDFMHFRSKGHELLALAIANLIQPKLKESQL